MPALLLFMGIMVSDCVQTIGAYDGTVAKTVDGQPCVKWDDPKIATTSDNNKVLVAIRHELEDTNHSYCR